MKLQYDLLLGAKLLSAHINPSSILQFDEQPSLLLLFPSSQSNSCKIPSPHIYKQKDVALSNSYPYYKHSV